MSSLKDKTAKIIVVDTSSPIRQQLAETLRAVGFADVRGVSNYKDALGILEVEDVDWIIGSIMPESAVNAMQILSLTTIHNKLRKLRVSFFAAEEDGEVLPFAYEKGLLNHFEKPFNKDSLTDQFELFLTRLDQNAWDELKLSASYLRQHLNESKDYQAAMALETSLLEYYPGESEVLINLGKTQTAIGQKAAATSTFLQVGLIHTHLKDQIQRLIADLVGEESNPESQTKVNILGLGRCIIVDSDMAVSKVTKTTLESIGIEGVECYDNGNDAWEAIQKEPIPDLIVQEWRIPKLTGPVLVQRIRKVHPCVPILAQTSLLKLADMPLVKEMGLAGILPKPLEAQNLLTSLVQIVQQAKQPTDAGPLEIKILLLLDAVRIEEAATLRDRYFALNISNEKKMRIEAEFAYAKGAFTQARDLAFQCIKGGEDSVGL